MPLLSYSSALRSVRGHLGRAKALVVTGSASTPTERAAVLHHLEGAESALAIVARGEQEVVPEPEDLARRVRQGRDPAHFQPNGRFLSEAGQRFLFGLFKQGRSIRSAAAAIGISPSSVADYHARWLEAKHPAAPSAVGPLYTPDPNPQPLVVHTITCTAGEAATFVPPGMENIEEELGDGEPPGGYPDPDEIAASGPAQPVRSNRFIAQPGDVEFLD